MTTRHAYAETAIGELLLVADRADIDPADSDPAGTDLLGTDPAASSGADSAADDALIGIYFPGHWYPPEADAIGTRVDVAADPFLRLVSAQLGEYLAGDRRAFDLAVRTRGDAFSEEVWVLLREIPYGETTTYGALAVALGNRNLAQRVGQAVGHNPVSIVIPCHRVVGADGSLTGFAGGLERKRHLLELEEPAEVAASRLF